MGKASKWFRGLLGLNKKPTDPPSSSSSQPGPNPNSVHKQAKKKWSFVKSYKEKDHYYVNNPTETSQHGVKLTIQNDVAGVDPNKHAIAVAAATAAVAEAAVTAAQAAAAVVRLTSSGRATSTTTATTTAAATPTTSAASANATTFLGGGSGGGADSSVHVSGSGEGYGSREEWAAVKIQSHFRAYLSRRALRALKALVKLQALVRGHIVRKQTADMIRRMQALLRVQARARAGRSQIFESPLSVSKYTHPGPPTPEKFEHVIQARSLKYEGSMMLKRNGSKSNGKAINDQGRAHIWEQQGSSVRSGPIDDRRSDKILEIDTGKPHITPKRRNLFHSSHLSLGSEQYSQSFTTSKESTAHQSVPSPSSCEVQSSGHLKFTQDLDDGCYCTADSSPQFYSASSKKGNSKTGPFTPTKSDGSKSCLSGYSDHPNYMSVTESSKAKIRSLSAPKQRPHYERSGSTKRYSIHSFNDSRINTQRVSTLHANFTNKAYPGSGRLDRLGMPVGGDAVGFSGGHWHRF